MDVDIEYLTPREQDELRALQAMFESDGWRVFQEKLEQAESAQMLACAMAEDERVLFRGQGRLAFIRELRTYEQSIEEGLRALTVERQIEAGLEAEVAVGE